MKKILAVFKKELRRFFTDRRMIISIFIPGVLIFVIYSLLGGVMTSEMEKEYTEFTIYVENEAISLDEYYAEAGITVHKNIEVLTKEQALDKISEGSLDLYISYEKDFTMKMVDYISGVQKTAPSIAIYYNSTNTASSSIRQITVELLDAIEYSDANKFDINPNQQVKYDLATEEDMSVMIIGMVLPFILMTFLISGAISVCSESIAGEKERGTIATLLVTPVKRSNLVIGKIAALGVVSMASAFVSFLGLILSLPKLVGASFSLESYGYSTIALLLLVVIVTSLFFTTILTIISTYARSVKEATGLALPLTMIVMVTGITSFTSGSGEPNVLMYLIPIYNSTQALTGILNKAYDIWAVVITVVTNIVYISLGVYLLTKMFDDEKIMFNK